MDQPAPTHWVGGDIPGLVVPGGVLAWDGGSGGCSLLVVGQQEEEGAEERYEPDVPGVVMALAGHHTSVTNLGT